MLWNHQATNCGCPFAFRSTQDEKNEKERVVHGGNGSNFRSPNMVIVPINLKL